jgi:hypothetical protein
MRTILHRKPIVILVLGALILAACSSPPRTSDLRGLYNELAQHEDPYRNPIVLIPGILGSKLANRQTDQFHRNGNLTIAATAPGDSVVLRSSALMNERPRDNPHSRLVSPIKWTQVFFLFSDHRKITRYPEFTDNLLYILLESP